ncbi:FG-GAP repeat domain-containing protein [Emticicia sp. SJ17W-69]|uniref:FG-GAP repeat domain-containing protein n=1 Tax=Emticicia sp. SJ17W-69 TaxID=3421657 RepID=UPI003EBDA24B
MKLFKIISYLSFIGLLFTLGCNKQSEGEKLAQTYCGSCHLFPEPSLLDKATWKNNILPIMAGQLGLQFVNGEVYPDIRKGDNGKYESISSISTEDWAKIVAFYQENAPEKLPAQARESISAITDLFSVKPISIPKSSFPSVTYIKIDAGNQQIYVGSDALFSIYDKNFSPILSQKVSETIVDIDFENDLKKAGSRSGFLTNIGILNPNDLTTGTLHPFSFAGKSGFTQNAALLDSLPRPVQSNALDLDKDGLIDQLICGYGNKNGALFWYQNKGKNVYKKNIIREFPGAIKAYIDDVNKDGLPDIWVLFAQAQEGIFLFTNKGKDTASVTQFEEKEILHFSPVHGSSYFEMTDLNNDGFKDILYTSGDNADYSTHLLKNFHGVYGYLNDGKNQFKQAFFFPIHGCFKAIARDFDKDGDIDIATIAYFPDTKNQPQEAFVYLENKGNLAFKPFTIKEANVGNWLVMDAADIDADGDEDIVLGNFDRVKRQSRNGSAKDTSVLVLMNRLK